jgi:myo-inositol-1-phosphate synthase
MKGIQDWLSFYFKDPMSPPTVQPENNLFVQLDRINKMLRFLMEEEDECEEDDLAKRGAK